LDCSIILISFQLAESLEKHRVDYSILVWDVNSRPSVSGPVTPERGHTHLHHGSSENNIITKPIVELGKSSIKDAGYMLKLN
jgi:hypothetical protein